MTRAGVHDGWTVRAVGGDVPAHVARVRIPPTVPGCVHLDPLAAGLIPDPAVVEPEAFLHPLVLRRANQLVTQPDRVEALDTPGGGR